VIVQFGGQTPLKLAHGLEQAGVTILGTSVDAIDLAEDRGRFGALLDSLGYAAPPYATARSVDEAIAGPPGVGWPLPGRPAHGLGVVGLINVQYGIHAGELYVIEANPRASRTVPFVSKAIGLPLAKMACRLMLGEKLCDLGLPADPMGHDHVSVKEAVLPFDRF